MKSLNKDLSLMLNRVSMDLSEITNMNSSVHSTLSHFDHQKFADQASNECTGFSKNVKMQEK